ncbi:hypothetical protein [Paenibacillus thiaminolyticus]|uniref:Uncharacterized protein n=1 Tax=Paenibacillus thiaminolyticus TaxID=49283 RepID=A0A3A3GTE1_PANTH|nr:hypothetical protein [Paenibacillus thiaminolyticus]RJG20615.1 hypothetical protein DQX05_24525 [Paenibacillus thiaminolyticus]
MKIFKKMLAVLLSMAIMIVFLPTPTFADNVEENYNTIRTNVVDENFNIVGTKISAFSTATVENDGVKTIKIRESTRYQFFTQQERFKRLFRDAHNESVIEITEDGKYYIDGDQLSDEELNAEVNYGSNHYSFRTASRVESGGREDFTYYTNMGISPYNYFKCLARETSNNIFMDSPRGGKITKWLYSGSDLSDFKMYANNVAAARSAIDIAASTLVAEGVLTVVTGAAILGLIGSVPLALTIYENSNSGNEAMRNAYNLLEGADGYQPSS